MQAVRRAIITRLVFVIHEILGVISSLLFVCVISLYDGCLFPGYPEPSVTWSHNGGPLDPSCLSSLCLNKVTLVLPRVAQAHAGRYTCAIDNEAGSSQCTCDLVVKSEDSIQLFLVIISDCMYTYVRKLLIILAT